MGSTAHDPAAVTNEVVRATRGGAAPDAPATRTGPDPAARPARPAATTVTARATRRATRTGHRRSGLRAPVAGRLTG